MNITDTALLNEAAALLSEHGENPEYDRAIAELTATMIGTLANVGRVTAQLRTIHPITPTERPTMTDSATTHYFGDPVAQIVYEYIDQSDGRWHLNTQTVHHNGEGYAKNIRDIYNAKRAEHEGRADRRNLRINIRPGTPHWIEVPFSPDTTLVDIEGALHACEHATWTPGRVPGLSTGDFINGLIAGGGTNIE